MRDRWTDPKICGVMQAKAVAHRFIQTLIMNEIRNGMMDNETMVLMETFVSHHFSLLALRFSV
jgi:hypothetical protein